MPTPAARDAVMAAGEWNAAVARIRRDLVHVLGAAAFPRRLRFLRELPADARGKTPASAVRAALDANCREPVVASWSATAGRLVAEMAFPKDCECFAGHFPGRPILPGVAQLFFLRKYAHQAFADFPDAGTYVKLKFKRIVLPGETLALDVVRKAPGVFAFTMSVGGETASCGTLEGAAK